MKMNLGRGTALALAYWLICAPGLAVQAQSTPGQAEGPLTEHPRQSQGKASAAGNAAPPRSDNPERSGTPELAPEQSSSEQTRIDLSDPRADELAHPDADGATGEHEWNPLRAMKDVEVGTYYYNAGNYKAAISRFREALQFKPRDAVATFRLAQALEKSGEIIEARAQYEAYLAVLKEGPDSGEARKALERLKKR
jgi:tetratricopeptide (TPR) repeat protein